MESKLNRVFRLYQEAKSANPYLYFELAHTRQTGWMAWLIDKQGGGRNVLVEAQHDDPDDPLAYAEVLDKVLVKLEEMGFK